MILLLRHVCFIVIGCAAIAPQTGAAAAPAKPAAGMAIVRIDGESDKAMSIVTVALSGKPEWPNPVVEDHGTFVQVLLPATVVPSPGTFLDANSPFITKIAAFQVPNPVNGQLTDAAVRLFVNRDASSVKKAIVGEILADRVVVTLDHKKLDTAISASGEISNPAAAENSATMDGIETTNAAVAPTSPAELVKAEASRADETNTEAAESASWTGVGTKVPDLSGKLAIASGFSLFMLALLGIVYKWKQISPFGRKFDEDHSFSAPKTSRLKNIIKHRVPASENGEDFARDMNPFTMKAISTMHIGPRQKLTLVQVGTETVLLSISPSGVQFLTTVGQGALGAQGARMAAFQPVAANLPQPQLAAPSMKSFEDRVTEEAIEEFEEAPAPKMRPASASGKGGLKMGNRQGATTKKVRVAVTDDGITNIETNKDSSEETRPAGKPSDDITRLIREKLRNLPVI